MADGYGNARIHQFSPSGELRNSFGDVGTGPGQFHLPHGIALDRDENIIVCDRENDRLQFFDRTGRYITMWTDVLRPTDVTVDKDGLIYVSELWRPMEPGQGSFVHGFAGHDLPGRVSVFRGDGKLVARWGADSEKPRRAGQFHRAARARDRYRRAASMSPRSRPRSAAASSACRWRTRWGHQIQKFARVG
ncbi:MAG: 6-bladed beta-propeller [Sphingomonas sp.]